MQFFQSVSSALRPLHGKRQQYTHNSSNHVSWPLQMPRKAVLAGTIAATVAFVGGACSADRTTQVRKQSAETPVSRRMPDGKEWTTSNLSIEADGSYCYADSDMNCRRYGRLYTWEAAQRACASLGPRWRLPTDGDWRGLASRYGGVREDSRDNGKTAYSALVNDGPSPSIDSMWPRNVLRRLDSRAGDCASCAARAT